MEVRVVISHYKENIEWLNNIKYPFFVYSNHSLEQEECTNKGREANGYLKYIIDNYYELSEYSIFIHGDRIAYHHDGNLDDIINNLEFNKSIQTLNNRIKLEYIPLERIRLMSSYIDVFDVILKKKFDLYSIQYYGNAQFYVHKNNILKYNKETYIKIYNWKNRISTISNWDIGLIFEYMWYEMFK